MHKSEVATVAPACQFAVELQVRAGQRCFLHSHACTELVWYRGCHGWLPQAEDRLRYRPDSVAVYQPGVLHGDECERGGSQVCVGVIGAGAELLPAGMWRPDAASLAAWALLRREVHAAQRLRAARLDLLCGWLVLELRRQLVDHLTGATAEPSIMTTARRICDTRFAQSLTVQGIAAELSLNPDYLRQLFLKWTGQSPIDYLIHKRLECACDLLRLNQLTIHEVAARSGIPNPYYFSRLFRKRMGCTPSEYRSRYVKP